MRKLFATGALVAGMTVATIGASAPAYAGGHCNGDRCSGGSGGSGGGGGGTQVESGPFFTEAGGSSGQGGGRVSGFAIGPYLIFGTTSGNRYGSPGHCTYYFGSPTCTP